MNDDANYRGPHGETYWGEPLTDDDKQLVANAQSQALFTLIANPT